jgi:phage-related protein
MRRRCATHAIHHFFAHFDGWRKWLWVAPQDVSEVNYRETIVSICRQSKE